MKSYSLSILKNQLYANWFVSHSEKYIKKNHLLAFLMRLLLTFIMALYWKLNRNAVQFVQCLKHINIRLNK